MSKDLELEPLALLWHDCIKANVSYYLPSHREVTTFAVGMFIAAKHKAMLNEGHGINDAKGQDSGL